MKSLPDPVERFLGGRRIAVAGVSRSPNQPANAIFRRLASSGRDVVPLNPNASEVEGVPTFPDVEAVPGTLDGVVIATHPDVSASIVRACADRGVPRVWIHRSFGHGSVSSEALAEARRLGVECIEGGCPLMFCEPVDLGHRCMRWWLQRRGRVPR